MVVGWGDDLEYGGNPDVSGDAALNLGAKARSKAPSPLRFAGALQKEVRNSWPQRQGREITKVEKE